MAAVSTSTPTVIHTERGLTIAGTRITLYDVMDYVTADWPPKLIRDRLNLTDQQIADVMNYIAAHRAEVEAEYQEILREAQAIRQYWEDRNRERLAQIAALPLKPGQEAIREKLRTWKTRIETSE
jgi:uncharacterized protein (DUF433 family)